MYLPREYQYIVPSWHRSECEAEIRVAIAYGRPRLVSVPELSVRYEIALSVPRCTRSVFQLAVRPTSIL